MSQTQNGKAYAETVKHLTRFGEARTAGFSGMQPRWNADTIKQATELLRLYFFGTSNEIEKHEAQMIDRVIGEVRRRFAGACFMEQRVADTPGQAQPWFSEAREAAAKFHTERKAQLAAKRANTQASATAASTNA